MADEAAVVKAQKRIWDKQQKELADLAEYMRRRKTDQSKKK